MYDVLNSHDVDYYYLRNIQGDITSIINKEGIEVASYTYDAWGNHVVNNLTEDNIGDINPFRYRGYYYDKEIKLYYLNARYYDPETGRFISQDNVSYLEPNTINGLNLYAYCGNNPVMFTDPSGKFPWLILAALLLFTPVGGVVTQTAVSIVSYVGMAGWAVGDLVFNGGQGAWKDMNAIGWNPFNTNESATLNSNNVSFYKGVPVFRTASDGRSSSFGAIFLTRGSGVDTLRHERGHNWQLMMMGIANYGLMIGLPSAFEWSTRSYYERPWEITADVFGGVRGRTHTQSDINRGYWYLGVSSLFGPFGYFFLIGEY